MGIDLTNDILEKLDKQSIENIDLSPYDLTERKEINFSGKTLKNMIFSGNKTLKGIDFQKATLIDCQFEDTEIKACDFSSAKIIGTGEKTISSFKGAKISGTKFKEAEIEKTKFTGATVDSSDFRYMKITDCSLQEARFSLTDFYQTAFKGITIFQHAEFEACSLNYISFDSYCITRNNLKKNLFGVILAQENKNIYDYFLDKMSVKKDGLAFRFKEAERIYRQFSVMWAGKGLNKDSEWAYTQAKRMERKSLFHESKERKIINRISAAISFLLDISLGYGFNLKKTLGTFLVMIIVFGLVYYFNSDQTVFDSIKESANYTFSIKANADYVLSKKEGISAFLSFLQKGMGGILLGYIGFVVANRIRNF